jgi:hypothetical protein
VVDEPGRQVAVHGLQLAPGEQRVDELGDQRLVARGIRYRSRR